MRLENTVKRDRLLTDPVGRRRSLQLRQFCGVHAVISSRIGVNDGRVEFWSALEVVYNEELRFRESVNTTIQDRIQPDATTSHAN